MGVFFNLHVAVRFSCMSFEPKKMDAPKLAELRIFNIMSQLLQLHDVNRILMDDLGSS